MKKSLIIIVGIIFFSFSINFSNPALAGSQAEKIFQVNCAGCHPHGGNIIRRGKNLSKKALQRNGFDSLEAMTTLIANGRNNMSAFAERLTPEEIENVANYVLKQAENNWP